MFPHRSLLAFAVLGLIVTMAGGAQAHGADAHHVVLWYVDESFPDDIATQGQPLVAYIDDAGVVQDWLFDGWLMMYDKLGPIANAEAVSYYEERLFDLGEIANLDELVSSLRSELGDPDYRLLVYLDACYYTGSDASAQVQALYDRWQAAAPAALELAGFYFSVEEAGSAYAGPMLGTADYIHSHFPGLEFIWIPRYDAPGASGWASYGVDRASMQPGYAFSSVGTWRFEDVDDLRLNMGLHGLELEIGYGVENSTVTAPDAQLEIALTYLRAANHYNWGHTSLMTYYLGNAIWAYAATQPERRSIYDALYGFIAQHQRRSVARRVSVPVTADAWTEQAVGYTTENHGQHPELMVGTNEYPNAARTFLLFNDPQLLEPGQLLAAHLTMQESFWPYGSDMVDVSLYRDDDPTWDESILTAESEPSTAGLSKLWALRFNESAAGTYSWDLTSTIAAMRAGSDARVGFALRRDTEDGSPRQVAFHSREGSGIGPSLTLVFERCVPGSTCPSADGCSEGTEQCVDDEAVCSGMTPLADGTPCEGGVCRGGVCSSDGGGGSGATGEGGGGVAAGADGAVPTDSSGGGCGCRVLAGEAAARRAPVPSAWLLAWIAALAVRRRRSPTRDTARCVPAR